MNNHFLTTLKRKEYWNFSLIILSFIFFLYCLYQIGVFNSLYISGIPRFFKYLKELFSFKSVHQDLPSSNLWEVNFTYLLTTIKTVVGGSYLGFLLSYFTSYFSAKNLHKHKFFAILLNWFLIILRSFPLILYIFVFRGIFRPYLAAFFIFFWSTWLWVHKYLVEIIENTPSKYYWIDLNLGYNKKTSFKKNIYSPNKNRFTMNNLLAFDSNIRWSSILGSVGIVGIGFWIENNKTEFIYLGISLLYLYLTVIFFELLMFLYNKYFKDYWYKITSNKNYHKTLKYKLPQYLWRLLQVILFGIFLWSIWDLIKDESIQIDLLILFLKDIFALDFSDLATTSFIDYYDYFLIFINTYAALYSASILAIIYAFFMSEKSSQKVLSWFLKSFLVFLKTIPILVIFILFNAFLDSLTVLNFVLFLSAFRTLAKHIVSKINAYSNYEINLYKSLGYSNFGIYYQKILPTISKDLYSLIFFEYENTFRNALTYGIFSTIAITNKIQYYHERNIYNKTIPLLLPAILFFLILEILNYWSKKRKINKIKNIWKLKTSNIH